jgi:hypothetical protein
MIAGGVNANPNFWAVFGQNGPKTAEKSGKVGFFWG